MSKTEAAEWFFETGTCYYLAGQNELALECFERANHYRSRHPHALRYSGFVLMEMRRYREAISAFSRSIVKGLERDSLISTCLNIAACYCTLKQYDQSETWCRLAIKSNGENPLPHCTLAGVYWEQGYLTLAWDEFTAALELDSACTLALNSLGNLAQLKGNLKEALKFYRAARKAEPRNPIFLYNICDIYALLHWPRRERRAMETLRKLDPKFDEAIRHAETIYQTR